MSFVGRHISSLPTPALIVDKEKVIPVNFCSPPLPLHWIECDLFCPSLRQTAKRCSIWRKQTRSRCELRPKPTRRWRGAFCRFHQLSFLKNLWTDGRHKKEDCHLDPGGDRDVRGRRVRGHPLRIPVHRRASGSRLEAQGEAGGVPFDGLRGAEQILF